MNHFEEMRDWVLPQVAKVNRLITWPVIEKKTGLKVVSEGRNFGEVVTNVDIEISQALLNGGLDGVDGLRSRYPGSFSEEEDTYKRLREEVIYEVDPLDGTGDFKKTYATDQVTPPTTLVTKLQRDRQTHYLFRPVAGMIFDIINEYALISDGTRLGLFIPLWGRQCTALQEIPFNFGQKQIDEWTGHSSTGRSFVYLGRRYAYPQENYDIKFKTFNDRGNYPTKQVPVGGAGLQALQFFRQFIHPNKGTGVDAFVDLHPINLIFNCQPDWKTWDTDPTLIIHQAILTIYRNSQPQIGDIISERSKTATDILGRPLTANAAYPLVKYHMKHKDGFVLSSSSDIQSVMLYSAKLFMAQTGLNLLDINY